MLDESLPQLSWSDEMINTFMGENEVHVVLTHTQQP